MKQYHRNRERNEALIAHVAKGGKPCEIRNRLGMSEAAADAVLHRARKSGRLSPAPKLHGDDARERDAGIRKMLDAGLSQAEIARRLCVSANTVIGAVDRMRKRGELPPAPPKRRAVPPVRTGKTSRAPRPADRPKQSWRGSFVNAWASGLLIDDAFDDIGY
jgi:transposase